MISSRAIAQPNARRTRGARRYEEREHVLWLLKRAFHSGHRAVNDAVRGYGVTPTQLGALNRLDGEPGLSGAELSRRLLVTPQAAQLALASLEERGLVERRPDANHGRIVRTYLTEEGQREVQLTMDEGVRAESDFLAVLNKAERKQLIDLLTRLATQ